MKVTKAQVIEAIENETHLEPGFFIYLGNYDRRTVIFDAPECTVCAVGAVLRKCLAPIEVTIGELDMIANESVRGSDYAGEVYGREEDLFDYARCLLEDGQPLAALSTVFESEIGNPEDYDGHIPNYDVALRRKAAVRFVHLFFPDTIEIATEVR